jgi:hypothetical protein
MHGHMNVKFVNVKQAKETYQYRNAREKLYKTNAAIWYNKICREKQLTPNYEFHPGPARKLSSNLYDIHQYRMYSE